MTIQPYLYFEGRAEEAAAFYERALGAQTQMLMRYEDSPLPPPDGMMAPGWEGKVMHMSLKIGDSILFGSDGVGDEQAGFKGFALSFSAKDEDEADRVFAALADGGETQMRLARTFFSPCFGMVTDRFGVQWLVVVRA